MSKMSAIMNTLNEEQNVCYCMETLQVYTLEYSLEELIKLQEKVLNYKSSFVKTIANKIRGVFK